MDKHVWEISKARVIVSMGRVVAVENDPTVKFCPLHYTTRNVEELTREAIKESIEFRINVFGLCTPRRVVELDLPALSFGASEVLMTALKHGLIDSSVTVCDGAGTVVTDQPKLVQGIGMVMSALIETTPIPEIIEKLKEKGGIILDEKTAKIDQLAGVEEAFKNGYRKIGVTVMGPEAEVIPEIRLLEEKYGGKVLIFVIHTTGVRRKDIYFIEKADVVYGCASKFVREIIGPKAISTYGRNIPAYTLTKAGEEILKIQEETVSKSSKQVLKVPFVKPPSPLI